MYEELAPDGSTRMVGTLEDLQKQQRLRNHNKVDDEFISDMWSVMDRAGNLLISKHHDYGPLNIARSPGGPINGLRVRMWDKIARINNLVDNKTQPNNESLRDSFLDLLNYSAIALMVLDGKWPEVQALDCE
ncbi:MAG: DUF1599 domain-containing protein [Cyanobacteria bacterium REEB494]|nr:DUF1599 domain-containing protein [Cyanobacteria bacterium REEB494]